LPYSNITESPIRKTTKEFRTESGSLFVKKERYDIYNGNNTYLYSENRKVLIPTSKTVEVCIVTVDLSENRVFRFLSYHSVFIGDSVYVVEHHIGCKIIIDVFCQKSGLMLTSDMGPFDKPSAFISGLIGFSVSSLLVWQGRAVSGAFIAGISTALTVIVIAYVYQIYGIKGLAILRWRADRKIRCARKSMT
jgi:hypothetical protein